MLEVESRGGGAELWLGDGSLGRGLGDIKAMGKTASRERRV